MKLNENDGVPYNSNESGCVCVPEIILTKDKQFPWKTYKNYTYRKRYIMVMEVFTSPSNDLQVWNNRG